jgi:(R,R)-butanediol dehydrogenase / meso-butanediol dehydrogenase / diacetyl reductase
MKAAVFHQVGKPLAIETVADPIPENGEVIIKIMASGICGTDPHATVDEGMLVSDGTVLGHEFAGEVTEVGPDVPEGWAKGDRLCAMPFIGCGKCLPCLTGMTWQCPSKKIIGFDVFGGFAEYARVHVNEAVRLPDAVTWREGALVEPLSVGLHAVRSARCVDGKNVLVIGAGPIGLSVALWCKFLGARQVIASDLSPGRAQMALKFGATGLIDPKDDMDAQFVRLAGGPPEVIFECVGIPGMIGQCIDRASYGAEIIVVGFCAKPDTFVPAQAMVKEISMIFSICYSKSDFQYIVDMMAAGRICVGEMITDVISLNDLPVAFEGLRKPSSQCKVILET